MPLRYRCPNYCCVGFRHVYDTKEYGKKILLLQKINTFYMDLTTLFCLVSVANRLELCVPITFFTDIIFIMLTLNIIFCVLMVIWVRYDILSNML